MKRICCIGTVKRNYFKDLEKHCISKNYKLTFLKYKDIFFSLGELGNFQMQHRLVDILDFDLYVFNNVTNPVLFMNIDLLAKYLKGKDKKIINNTIDYSKYPLFIVEYIAHGINHIPINYTFGLKSSKDVLIDMAHPIQIVINTKLKEYSEDWTESTDIIRSKAPIDTVSMQKDFIQRNIHVVYFIDNEIVFYFLSQTDYKKKKRVKKYTIMNTKDTPQQILSMMPNISKITHLAFGKLEFLEENEYFFLKGVKAYPKYKHLEKKTGINFANKVYTNLVG